jgi:LmbE family N-acetylglucosaminyl deacetylase
MAVGHRTWLALCGRARSLDENTLASLSPILVLAPHQDDETLGCGGLLATASRLGLKPRVAYLTDGAASHCGSRAWPAARLSRARRCEALSALSLLGVPRQCVRFLGWADARPFAADDPRYRQSLAQVARWVARFGARSIWAPWRGERHCDHIAAARFARDLCGCLAQRPVCMDYLVWGWCESGLARAAPNAWKLDCAGSIDARRRALACHRTQMGGLIADASQAFQIPPRLAALTQRPVEIYLQGP